MESAARPTRSLPGVTRVWLIGSLLALAAGTWARTGERMQGTDAGPGTDLGGPG